MLLEFKKTEVIASVIFSERWLLWWWALDTCFWAVVNVVLPTNFHLHWTCDPQRVIPFPPKVWWLQYLSYGIPSANPTWRAGKWTIYKSDFTMKTLIKKGMFNCRVWLPNYVQGEFMSTSAWSTNIRAVELVVTNLALMMISWGRIPGNPLVNRPWFIFGVDMIPTGQPC